MEWTSLAFAIVFGIGIVLAFTMQVIKMGLAHEEKRMAFKAGTGDAGRLVAIVAANEAEMAKLRQRVEVLERLATDGDRKLSHEIAGLRNDRTAV